MNLLLALIGCDGAPSGDSACTPSLVYLDADLDGFGTEQVWARACLVGGWSLEPGDCDDGDASQHPEGEGLCDCGGLSARRSWYEDSDGDGYGAGPAQEVCQAAEGWVSSDGDCAPDDPETHPGAEEVWYDGVDQDCDGGDDFDADRDGWPLDEDCDDQDSGVHPGAQEICDEGLADEDCDGRINADDDDAQGWRTWYLDSDGDGHGVDAETVQACGPTEGYASEDDDCDDERASVSPSAEEICGTGLDEDCDGAALECGLDGRQSIEAAPVQVQGLTTLGWELTGADLDGQPRIWITAPSANGGAGFVAHVPASLQDDWELPGEATWGLSGAATSDNLGQQMVALDERVAVASPSAQDTGRGLVYLLTGTEEQLEEAPLLSGRVGEAGGFGAHLERAPDLNEDGQVELLVADPLSSFSTSYGGEIAVFLSPHTEDSDVYAAFATVAGTTSLQLGYGCLASGDLHGDGLPELIAGRSTSGAGGRVWAWELGEGGRLDFQEPDDLVEGASTQELGDSCAVADVDDDGLDDLLVGYAGLGYGAELFTDGLVSTATFLGASDLAGRDVLLPGDLDGDGTSDIVVGVPHARPGGSSQVGAAFVHWGPASGSVVLAGLDGVEGSVSGDRVGERLGSAGDVDGDGDVELLLGLPYRSRSGAVGGAVLIPGGPGI